MELGESSLPFGVLRSMETITFLTIINYTSFLRVPHSRTSPSQIPVSRRNIITGNDLMFSSPTRRDEVQAAELYFTYGTGGVWEIRVISGRKRRSDKISA